MRRFSEKTLRESKAHNIIQVLILNELGPDFKTLKKYRVNLTAEERRKVMDNKAYWHMGNKSSPSPAVWKSDIRGNVWYTTNTHRAYNVTKTLKGTIKRFHDFIKSTA